jgi:hypothetical protein
MMFFFRRQFIVGIGKQDIPHTALEQSDMARNLYRGAVLDDFLFWFAHPGRLLKKGGGIAHKGRFFYNGRYHGHLRAPDDF